MVKDQLCQILIGNSEKEKNKVIQTNANKELGNISEFKGDNCVERL